MRRYCGILLYVSETGMNIHTLMPLVPTVPGVLVAVLMSDGVFFLAPPVLGRESGAFMNTGSVREKPAVFL